MAINDCGNIYRIHWFVKRICRQENNSHHWQCISSQSKGNQALNESNGKTRRDTLFFTTVQSGTQQNWEALAFDEIYDDIQVGNIVSKWYPLWQVGKTWVPDKNYSDYHLHFELRKNPYISDMIWKNTNYEYMNWDWYFKGETWQYIKENQYTIFEN